MTAPAFQFLTATAAAMLTLLLMICRCTIRDKIIPNAVSWFTGEALQSDGPNMKDTVIDEDAGQDNGDEDEEDEDEDSDDDEDEDEHYKANKRIHV